MPCLLLAFLSGLAHRASWASLFPADRMPNRPKTICRHPGCGRLIDEPGYCERHLRVENDRKAFVDRRRGNSHARGYTHQWHKERTLFLKSSPLCASCERVGRLTAATVVDHIVPHKGNHELFWDEQNWQALCVSCHNSKTAREDGGFGNATSKRIDIKN